MRNEHDTKAKKKLSIQRYEKQLDLGIDTNYAEGFIDALTWVLEESFGKWQKV